MGTAGGVVGGPPHDGENFGLPGTLKNQGGAREGGDFWPPKAVENFFTPPG